MTQLEHLQAEYQRIYAEFEAVSNLPQSVKPSREWLETLNWLDTRLSSLEQQIEKAAQKSA